MATTPPQELILDEIFNRLGNIKIENGYTFQLKKITRSKRSDFKNGDLPECDLWADNTEHLESKYNLDSKSLSVFFRCWTNKTDKIPLTTVSTRLAQDIIIAINRSVQNPNISDQNSKNLGGLASNIAIISELYLIGDEQHPWAGVDININVNFYTAKNDPTVIKNP